MNNSTSSIAFETHILTDGDNPSLQLRLGRDDTGTFTVDMRTHVLAIDAPVRITLNGAVVGERNISATRKPCDCSDTAESVLGDVHVRHHENCLHGEPRRYMWRYLGTIYTGSLADYAQHWESLDPEVQHALIHTRDELRTWTDSYQLIITCDIDDHRCLRYRLSVGDEWISVDTQSHI